MLKENFQYLNKILTRKLHLFIYIFYFFNFDLGLGNYRCGNFASLFFCFNR